MKTTLAALLTVLWASFAQADVVIIRQRPRIVVAARPIVAMAPAAVIVRAGPTAAQRRHARKAAYHADRAAYWAGRS